MSELFMRAAIRAAQEGMRAGKGGPFGAVVARGETIIAAGSNEVLATGDPTAHAEVVAIRRAASALGTYHLEGCDLYATCEPCPMCLGAAYWARVASITFAATREDAAAAGFGDAFIYEQLARPLEARAIPMRAVLDPAARELFEEWSRLEGRELY